MAIKINNTTIIDDSRNIVNAGVVTATSFSGSGAGLTGVSGIASNTSINTSGIVTASGFVGNVTGNVTGNLTGTASTATAAATAFGLTGSPNVTVGVLTATRISAGSTTGTSGQVLQSTGTGVTWTAAPAGGISVSDSNLIGYDPSGARNDGANGRLDIFGTGNFRVFTSPGTYVVNPGISSIRVRVIGAGGNGGTSGPPSPGEWCGGSGGGGGYAHKVITSFSAPRTYTVTVGSAPGGTSSFGSEVSATGGSNGANGSSNAHGTPGSGGTGSGGNVNYTGASGESIPPDSNNPTAGKGGAAATQKGNGSGSSVPGLPGFSVRASFTDSYGPRYSWSPNTIDPRFISRFPFDIFIGTTGLDQVPNPGPVSIGPSNFERVVSGFSGGSGGNYASAQTFNGGGSSGGTGGDGAGGGRGGRNYFGGPQPGGTGGYGGGGGGSAITGSYPGYGGSGGSGLVIVEW